MNIINRIDGSRKTLSATEIGEDYINYADAPDADFSYQYDSYDRFFLGYETPEVCVRDATPDDEFLYWIYKPEDNTLHVTDASTGATSWLWELYRDVEGEPSGEFTLYLTSTDQNPVFTLVPSAYHKLKLTINGGASTVMSGVFMVV